MKNWYQNPHVWWTDTKSSHMWKLVPNYRRSEELELNRHRCQCQNCEELESNAKCSRFGGHFINVRNRHVCYIKYDFVCIFHKVRDIGTKYVTYWYQLFTFCEEFGSVKLRSVKFVVQQSIHIWTIVTLEGWHTHHEHIPQSRCPWVGPEVKI